MKTGRILGWAALAAVTCLLPAGCANSGVEKSSNPAAVVGYDAPTWYESLAMSSLKRSDEKAREGIDKAFSRFEEAYSELMEANDLYLSADALPPKVTRPTEKDVRRLAEETDRRWAAYNDLITLQMERYEGFLQRYPENWYEHHRLAWFLADNHREGDAAFQWERVIKMQPGFPYAYNNLASLYDDAGRSMDAIDNYRKAIELKDDDPDFHHNLAVAYTARRFEVIKRFGWDLPRVWKECMSEYYRARDLAPKDRGIAYDLATQFLFAKYFQVGDTSDEALRAWDYYLTLDLDPGQRGRACRNVGNIYLMQKKNAAVAFQWYEKAQKLLPKDPEMRALVEKAKARQQAPPP